MKRLLVAIVTIIALVGCDHGRSRALKIASPEATQLVAETRDLWVRYQERKSTDVPVAEYPETVRKLLPERVWATKDGVYIQTHSLFVENAGIFVRYNPECHPPRNGDPGFETIATNVYWFYAPG